MNEMPNMQPNAELRECFSCYHRAVVPGDKCPRCGKKMYTESSVRKRGVVSIITGLFLVGLMTGIAVFVGLFLAAAMKDPDSAKKINSEAGMLLVVYAIFAALIAFGVNSMVHGAWMAFVGRRSRVLVWAMWGLLLLIFVAAGAFRALT